MLKMLKSGKWKVLCLATALSAGSMQASATLNIADKPLFLVSIPPVVMVMLDNSGSMKEVMYTSGYNNATSYHGIFDSAKSYEYDGSILVNTGAYSVTVDSSKTGAFVESSCTPSSADTTCWSGNYLNWLTTRRIDSSRQVLVGGKLESHTAFAYGTDGSGNTLSYKVVANNEYADRNINKSHASSADYSPIPNGTTVTVYSPADTGGGGQLASYDPYAKMTGAGGGGIIYNSAGVAIGEFGRVSATHNVTTISLANTYTSPVAVAKPGTYNGGNEGLVNITELNSTQLKVQFKEWDYLDGNHTNEDIPYIVMEAGLHTLPGGQVVRAGSVSTSDMYVSGCSTSQTGSTSVSFVAGFLSTPVVLHSVISDNDTSDPVGSRAWDITSSGMKVALFEEEANADAGGHGTETIGYIAIEAGTLTDPTNNWALEAGTVSNVSDADKTLNFTSSFSATPTFLAAANTVNGADSFSLRVKSVTNSDAEFFIDEEQSCDTEKGHTTETVGYVALQGSGDLNIALAVVNKPTGLLQDIHSKVRMGLSFYRYDFDSNDIYNGEQNHGGTLKFKIPHNPFVKKPSASGGGGYRELTGYVGTGINDIVDAIEHYPLVWGTTPLAENLWEVIQYFEQEDNNHNNTGNYYAPIRSGFTNFDLGDLNNDGDYTDAGEDPLRDPFYYPAYSYALECASPSVIVFTDGYPYRDSAIPAGLVDYDGDGAADEVSDAATSSNVGTDNLDDVAHWGFCDTSASGSCPDSNNDGVIDSDDEGNRDLRSDLAGDQSLRAYTVGFAGGTIRPVLQDTADNAGGQAYAAADGASLETALTKAFTDAISASSAAAVSVDTGSITSTTTLYQARFDGTKWTGEVLAYAIASDGSVSTTPTWKASNVLPAHGSRNIFTLNLGTGDPGIPFTWANLDASQKAALSNDSTLLDYLRGDQSNEDNTTGFRERTSLLGDIVHSSPQFIGAPNAPYPDSLDGVTGVNAYSDFKASSVKNRTQVVYTGANDGMLHAFDASSGVELFAYVPNEIMDGLPALASPSYAHRYFVDGPPTIVDAFFSNAWHTVLAGGLGAGGQGVYALDVTNPSSFSGSKVLWEFTDDDDADLGYTFSQPNIVRMHNGSWAAVFGNGFDNTEPDGTVSSTGKAVLFVRNLSDGSHIAKIEVGNADVANPNGLASVAPVDLDGDYVVDYIYAGDLKGNLWKFDVTSNTPASWSASKLFTACFGGDCTTDPVQPITSRPQVGRHPYGQGVIVYFGTGKYFEVGDDTPSGTTQTFYAVWDRGNNHNAFDRDHMLKQEVLAESTINSYDYRILSDNPITWHGYSSASLPTGSPPTTHLGWYMDLVNTENSNTNGYGEKQVSNPVLRGDRVIFATLLPSSNPCAAGGSGWLMELSTENGGRLPYTPFDVNNDGAFSTQDYVTGDFDGDGNVETVPVSGKKSTVGIIQTPGILADPSQGKEYKYTSGSTGDIEMTVENPGPTGLARQSWRQLY